MATQTMDIARSVLGRSQDEGRVFGLDRERLGRGLGWFSIGLGMTELLAPGAIARLTGSRNHKWLIRSYGIREIAAGVGILTSSQRSSWLWARVGGDVLDLMSLANAATSSRNQRGKTAFALASVAGVTALDVCCAAQESKNQAASSSRAEANQIIGRSPEECYRFWRNFENLARFMSNIESVRTGQNGASHWVALVPGGRRLEWDSEITEDIPNRRIAWHTVGDPDVQHSGAVDFEPAAGRRGTVLRVQIDYGEAMPTLSVLGPVVAKGAEQLVRRDLRRFKQALEVGEVLTTDGQPSGRRDSGVTWIDQIAR